MAKNWYVIHTYAGFEGRVKTSLLERANQMGLVEKLGQVLVPTDPALTGNTVDVALCAVVDGHLMSSRVFKRVKIPNADRRGIVLRLDKKPFVDVVVWEGSTLEVTVAASADASGPRTSNALRPRCRVTPNGITLAMKSTH